MTFEKSEPDDDPSQANREPSRDDVRQAKGGESHREKEEPAEQSVPKKSADKPLHGRIWPMPTGSYTFTQEYGCVPQIEGFYAADSSCPSDRPVVHRGIDLGANTGELIYAAASGWVTEAGYDRETGLANTRIVIQHDGRNQRYATEYLHWITTFVEPGDYVRVGEPIAEVGSVGWSTGPHLHFAVIDFERGGFIDPLAWLPRRDSSAYRDLPRGSEPITYDHPEASPAGVPDAADPNPAPVPERADLPGKHERVRPARDENRKAAHAERRALRLEREADRGERAAERRKRIRHADGETVIDENAGTSAPIPAPAPDEGGLSRGERDQRDRDRRAAETDSNRNNQDGRNDSGNSRRDSNSNDRANGGDSRNDGQDGGDNASHSDERGGRNDDDGGRSTRSADASAETGDAGEAPTAEPSLSDRVSTILDEIP